MIIILDTWSICFPPLVVHTPFTKDIGKNTDHGFLTGQKVTDNDSETDYYLAKLDDDYFVLATSHLSFTVSKALDCSFLDPIYKSTYCSKF